MTSNLKSFFGTNMLQVRGILIGTLISYAQKKLVMVAYKGWWERNPKVDEKRTLIKKNHKSLISRIKSLN